MPACAAIMGELDPRRVAAPEAPGQSGPATRPVPGASLWHLGDGLTATWLDGRYIVTDTD